MTSQRDWLGRIGVGLAIAAILAGCSSVPAAQAVDEARASNVPRAATSDAEAARAAALVNAFGFDLYGRLDKGNLVYSPASIAIALAMTRPGARGETAAQMDKVLHSLGSSETLGAINSLDRALAGLTIESSGGPEWSVTLRIANSQFAQRGMTFEQAYLDALASAFGAGVRLVDYSKDPEAARVAVNKWVADRTANKIPELLAPGTVDGSTVLTLVNAIYMKAGWLEPFDPALTKPAQFTHADGTRTSVPTMSGRINDGTMYAHGSGWQAVELPYVGGSLAMTVIVPDDLASFEEQLDATKWAGIVSALAPADVDLTLPKWKLETKADLARPLEALGMPIAFDRDRADFSGIAKMPQDVRLFIQFVVHQADIDVNEHGTEAAAATAVGIAGSGLPAPKPRVELHVDRPFIFAVRDRGTGAILFLGRVVDPSA